MVFYWKFWEVTKFIFIFVLYAIKMQKVALFVHFYSTVALLVAALQSASLWDEGQKLNIFVCHILKPDFSMLFLTPNWMAPSEFYVSVTPLLTYCGPAGHIENQVFKYGRQKHWALVLIPQWVIRSRHDTSKNKIQTCWSAKPKRKSLILKICAKFGRLISLSLNAWSCCC